MATDSAQLDQVFFALSDSTRRAIVGRLAAGSTTVGELSEPFAVSKPAISKHMKVLERAGLISRQIQGRQHLCDLNPRALEEARDWISFHRDFWENRLDELEKLLQETDPNTRQSTKKDVKGEKQ